VLIIVPALLGLTVVWQVVSGMFHTEAVIRQAVAVGQVTLEPDPLGARIDFVLVDSVGKETTLEGNLNVTLREPDGTAWRTSRSVSASDFQPLPDGSLLAGRVGYSILVPATDWARPPRSHGAATVSIDVSPSDDSAPSFSTVSQQLFP
jgi:hypothetical protein